MRGIFKSTAFFLAFWAILAFGGQASHGEETRLRWAPPELTNPITMQIDPNESYTGLEADQDYILEFPPTKKTISTHLQGGRNIVIIGGHIGLASNSTKTACIIVNEATGTVHIEGVLIENTVENNFDFDAITFASPNAILQIQNCRITGLTGDYDRPRLHADIVQNWGGIRQLRIDRLTGSSEYQGLFLPSDHGLDNQYGDTNTIGSAIFQNVDITFQTADPTKTHGYMLWFASSTWDIGNVYPLTLSNFYITPLPGKTLDDGFVRPDTNGPPGCEGVYDGTKMSWPTLPQVNGVVHEGPPPGGEFVPAGVAGLNYVSPGYLPQEPTPTPTPTGEPTPTPTPTGEPTPTPTPIPTPDLPGLVFEPFDDDPGWIPVTGGGSEIGYQATQSAGGTAEGEAGGTFVRDGSSYGADVGDLDPAESDLYANGAMVLSNTQGGNAMVGWWSSATFDAGRDWFPADFIGFRSDGTVIYAICTVNDSKNELSTANVSLDSPFDFVVHYDHNNGGSLAVSIDEAIPVALDLATGWQNDMTPLDRFGMASIIGNASQPADAFIDDVTYSSANVEPTQDNAATAWRQYGDRATGTP